MATDLAQETAVPLWNGVRDPRKAQTTSGGRQVRSQAGADVMPWYAAVEALTPGGTEYYRNIYMRAGLAAGGMFVVTSACQGEGKSTVSLAIAAALAQDHPHLRVALVETDFRTPGLAEALHLTNNPGLAPCLVNDLPVAGAYRSTPLENLTIVPGGGPVPNGVRWLCSPQMKAALQTLRHDHDIVLIDAPATTAESSALALTEDADGLLFIVKTGDTPAHIVQSALRQFPPAKIRGVVMNRVKSSVPSWFRRLIGLP